MILRVFNVFCLRRHGLGLLIGLLLYVWGLGHSRYGGQRRDLQRTSF